MAKVDANLFPKIIGVEGAAPGTPAAATAILYVKADGLWYSKDDAGVETLVSGGVASGIPATLLDAAGDTIVASAADTAVRRQNNDAASAAPTVNDDSGDGYSIGSRWLDTTADKEYVALDVTAGAAVWVETTASGGGYAPQTAAIGTAETRNNVAYGDLATPGPSVTVTVGASGIVQVTLSAWSNGKVGVDVSGANTAAAPAQNWYMTGVWTAGIVQSITFLLTGLSAGSTTFKMRYASIAAGNNAQYFQRQISVVAL